MYKVKKCSLCDNAVKNQSTNYKLFCIEYSTDCGADFSCNSYVLRSQMIFKRTSLCLKSHNL